MPALARRSAPGRPVIFVGLDGADWDLLDELMGRGLMPHLRALVDEGRSGVLESLDLPLSPLVWTTMMTGASPLEHRVLDFTRFSPATGEREPITGDERRVPAIWEMASAAGKRVAVFGLWATYPAEPVAGLLVSDRFLSFTSPEERPAAGLVFPPDREAWALSALDAGRREVGASALRAYLPWLTDAEYEQAIADPHPYTRPVSALQRILVETRVYHRLASEWLERERPDLAIVYFQGTDTLGHVFAPLTPPRRPGVGDDDLARFGRVPELYFGEVDRLLGEDRELARRLGAVLMVASDHGFHWRRDRPPGAAGVEAATAARWHRKEGIFLLWGPGVAPGAGARPHGRVDQVCATLLALLGLPPAAGGADPLPGAPAAQGAGVDYRALVPRAPAGEAGAGKDAEALAKLEALGYVGGGETSRRPGGPGTGEAATRTPGSYDNEGLLLRRAGRPAEAAAAFERALALDPGLPSARFNLSELLAAGDGGASDRERADRLLLEAVERGLPDAAGAVAARAASYRRGGDATRACALVDRGVDLLPDAGDLLLLAGRCRLDQGACAPALSRFERAAALAPESALAQASVGLARLCLGDAPGARRALSRSLELDPDQPAVRQALARLAPPRL